MGGKAKRRREKNYLAAHGGGFSRLPPPPDPSSVDVVPSKLRKLMSLTTGGKASGDSAKKKKVDGGRFSEKKQGSNDELERKNREIRGDGEEGISVAEDSDRGNEVVNGGMHEKKKKKRKRKEVNDLRFEASDKLVGAGSKRRERRKLRKEERKKKQKVSKEQQTLDYPRRDDVRFGDVVQAPPKLNAIPKASNFTQDASQERQRIQAVDDYRKRKGWTSRPGVQLDPSSAVPPLS